MNDFKTFLIDNGLSIRAVNVIMRGGIMSINELTGLTRDDILSFPNAGTKTLSEIEIFLDKFGRSLKKDDKEERDLKIAKKLIADFKKQVAINRYVHYDLRIFNPKFFGIKESIFHSAMDNMQENRVFEYHVVRIPVKFENFTTSVIISVATLPGVKDSEIIKHPERIYDFSYQLDFSEFLGNIVSDGHYYKFIGIDKSTADDTSIDPNSNDKEIEK